MSNDKKTPPWLLFNTKNGKNAVLAAIKYKIYDDSIDYDNLAAAYPDIDNFFRDDFPDLQNKFIQDQQKKPKSAAKKKDDKPTGKEKKDITPEKIEKRGRPLKGDDKRKEIVNSMLRTKNGDFLQEIKDNYPDYDIKNDYDYISMVNDTVELIKNNFFSENPDLIKKHPSIWFRNLCNTIKKNISPIYDKHNNVSVISDMWDIYADLCMLVGINRTIENFQIFSGLNWADIDKIKHASSPDYIDLAKKIYDSCRSDIVGGLSSSFGSSPNQMFIAKSIYGLTENTVITHVSANEIKRNLDDIPTFNIECNAEK